MAPSEKELRRLCVKSERRHRSGRRKDKKKKGGWREFQSVEPELRAVQRRLLRILRDFLPRSPVVHRSSEETVAVHATHRWFASLDIVSFYPSVKVAHIASALDRLGADPAVRDLILGLTTLLGCLPKGAPTSSGLSELILADLDAEIFREAQDRGISVSRWVDDIGISGDDRSAVQAMVELCVDELAKLGLQARKTDVLPLNVRRRFLGLNLNHARPSVPKAYRRRVASSVRQAARYGCNADQYRRLEGQIAYIAQHHPREARRLREMLETCKIAGEETRLAS